MNCNNESINVLKCQWDAKEIGGGGGGSVFRELFQCLDFLTRVTHRAHNWLFIPCKRGCLALSPAALPVAPPGKQKDNQIFFIKKQKTHWFGVLTPKVTSHILKQTERRTVGSFPYWSSGPFLVYAIKWKLSIFKWFALADKPRRCI